MDMFALARHGLRGMGNTLFDYTGFLWIAYALADEPPQIPTGWSAIRINYKGSTKYLLSIWMTPGFTSLDGRQKPYKEITLGWPAMRPSCHHNPISASVSPEVFAAKLTAASQLADAHYVQQIWVHGPGATHALEVGEPLGLPKEQVRHMTVQEEAIKRHFTASLRDMNEFNLGVNIDTPVDSMTLARQLGPIKSFLTMIRPGQFSLLTNKGQVRGRSVANAEVFTTNDSYVHAQLVGHLPIVAVVRVPRFDAVLTAYRAGAC